MTDRQEKVVAIETSLVDASASDRVEMVVRPLGDDHFRAAAVDGHVEFRRDLTGDLPAYEITASAGRNPLGAQDPATLLGHARERAALFPERAANAYPHAFDSVAQFFDADHAPDLIALHTASHHVDDHLGQHGSLGVVQARAPFIAAGKGIRSEGWVQRGTRTVDVAPTIAAVLDIDLHPGGVGPTGRERADARLARQDGDADIRVLDGHSASHVLVILLDGCNANLLHDVIECGEAPHIASLVGRGTGYLHGSMASLPTATLANHTTALTGAHPGHSGVLHNTWFDRGRDTSPDLLAMDQMFWSANHVHPEVETLFEALERSRPGAFSTATFEFCDRGATFSSFDLLRRRTGDALPGPGEVNHGDARSVSESAAYAFMSGVDHLSAQHTLAAWARHAGNELPTLSWCSLAVTDEAGHESGPHGDLARAAVRDSDARVGDLLRGIEVAGALENTAVFVIADHGMEQCDPTVAQPWDDLFERTGVELIEVGGGLVYLT